MSSVLFVGDLHLGHRTIVRHAAESGAYRGGTTTDEHNHWVIDQCLRAQPTKRTVWWLLGDVAMDIEKLSMLDALPGRKILVAGNHDLFDTGAYLKHVERVVGIVKKYGMWITHAPVHPEELRGHPNIHGHCHHHTLRDDPRYLNCAIEWLPGNLPMTLEQVRARFT